MKKCNILTVALLVCVPVVYFFSVIFSNQNFAFRDSYIYLYLNPIRCLLNVKYVVCPLSLCDDDFKLIHDELNYTLIAFKESAIILKYTATQTEIENNSNDSSYLVLVDNYSTGWKA